MIILIFWLSQKAGIFPELLQDQLLDEIHAQFFDKLKKEGMGSEPMKLICDDLNLRYKTYNEAFGEDGNLTRVMGWLAFFITERSKIYSNFHELDLPKIFMIFYVLSSKLEPMFKEYRKAIEN